MKRLTEIFIFILCIAISFFTFIYSALLVKALRYPVLYQDTFDGLVPPRDLMTPSEIVTWIFLPHNNVHLISTQKLLSLLGIFFKLPPGSLGIPLNIFLLFLTVIIIGILYYRYIYSTWKELRLSLLVCCLFIMSPAQYENIMWEFQTPWFLINCMVWVGTLLLVFHVRESSNLSMKLCITYLLSSPFIALFSSSQGFAFLASLTIISFGVEKRFGMIALLSSISSLFCYFLILLSSRPEVIPATSSSAVLRLGALLLFSCIMISQVAPPAGGLFLCIFLLSTSLKYSNFSSKEFRALLFPLAFGLVFVIQVSLGRSNNLLAAFSSRYITSSSMILVGILVITSYLASFRLPSKIVLRNNVVTALMFFLSFSPSITRPDLSALSFDNPARFNVDVSSIVNIIGQSFTPTLLLPTEILRSYNDRVKAMECAATHPRNLRLCLANNQLYPLPSGSDVPASISYYFNSPYSRMHD